ncbi:hypothetical protein ACFSSA_01410 [Luteolibacter algae]|uniref:Uncharacterized protein n=1 Tax=Luteolibacter algae TaxID=454151 RepID=A0ABW5D3L7_9BACT
MNALKSLCLVLAAIFVTSLESQAELAPEAYRKMQLSSPEALTIQVVDITSTRTGLFDFSGDRAQEVTAKIIKVERTITGLKIGDHIVIRYISENPGRKIAGPGPIAKLEKGRIYPAWLEISAGKTSYSPAARRASFSPLVE